jgi:hypothetical protein
MKAHVYLAAGAMLLASTTTALAADKVEFQLDENATYETVPDAAGFDPSAEAELPRGTVPQAPVMAPAPAPKSVPFAAPVKPEAPKARPIPLIKTQREATVAADVTYVAGGIGEDELASIKASKADYNVHMLSAASSGAFVGDIQVNITNAAGEVVLDVSGGPLIYVKLPQGKYTLVATLGEQQKKQSITIGKNTRSVPITLSWKVAATHAY